jgi:hypothetical protein
MKIYIQSRGNSPDFDYCWQSEVPSLLTRISSYIQSESPSVVLARFENQFILLVTGLASSDKKDFVGRVVRHSVAWVCEESDDNEKQLRAIAVQALQGVLSSKIDRLIQFGSKNGFKFENSEFEKLNQSILDEETVGNMPLEASETRPKMAKNSQGLRDSLAGDLQRSCLPKNYEIMVVVTGIKSEDSLIQTRIWRSLSNLVKSDNWKDIPKKESQQPNFQMAILAIVAVLAIAIIILIVLH